MPRAPPETSFEEEYLLVGLDSLDGVVFSIDGTLSLGDEFSSGQRGLSWVSWALGQMSDEYSIPC